MSFPTIPTAAAGRVVTGVQANTTATRTFPSLSGLTKNSGDLLVAIIVCYQSSLTSAIFSSWGAGFTEIRDIGVASQHCVGVAYKFSDGTETGTFTVAQAGTVTGHAAFILLSIPGAHASTPPEVSAALATGTSAAADPAALVPSWGAEDTLWVAARGSGETSTTGSFTGLGNPPANYSDSAQTGISQDAVGGVEAGTSFRQINTSSENVAAGSCDTSNARNCAFVIAVRPAPPETHSGALSATGGGVASTGGAKTAIAALTATGGGIATTGAQKGAAVGLGATGGGVTAVVATTDRAAAITATGGGVITVDYEVDVNSEAHDGNFAATGAGTASLEGTTDRQAPLAATGAGAGAFGATGAHSAALGATGHGEMTAEATTDRGAAVGATGGGTASLSAESARLGAMLLSGGGVLTTDEATQRDGDLAVTGGGRAMLEGSSAEDHTGRLAATGGGSLTTEPATQRLAALIATAGGGVALTARGAHVGTLAATGGGGITIGQDADPDEGPEAPTEYLAHVFFETAAGTGWVDGVKLRRPPAPYRFPRRR